MLTSKIQTQEEFEKMMEEIDADLQRQCLPISFRRIRGLGAVAKRLGVDIAGSLPRSRMVPGVFEGESLSAHVHDWFDRRYGAREQMSGLLGCSVYQLHGDPWLVKFPRIFGVMRLVCDPDLSKEYPNSSVWRKGESPPMLNAFSCIENITEFNLRRLTHEETDDFLRFFYLGMKTYQALDDMGGGLAQAICHDISMAARLCCNLHPEYGQSKWHSLQAAEKVLKLYISKKGRKYKRIHKLSKLVKDAAELGLPSPEEIDIDAIQCSAGIRYGEEGATVEAAAKAQMSAFGVVIHVVRQFPY